MVNYSASFKGDQEEVVGIDGKALQDNDLEATVPCTFSGGLQGTVCIAASHQSHRARKSPRNECFPQLQYSECIPYCLYLLLQSDSDTVFRSSIWRTDLCACVYSVWNRTSRVRQALEQGLRMINCSPTRHQTPQEHYHSIHIHVDRRSV